MVYIFWYIIWKIEWKFRYIVNVKISYKLIQTKTRPPMLTKTRSQMLTYTFGFQVSNAHIYIWSTIAARGKGEILPCALVSGNSTIIANTCTDCCLGNEKVCTMSEWLPWEWVWDFQVICCLLKAAFSWKGSLYGPLFQERDQEIFLLESRSNWDLAVYGDFAVSQSFCCFEIRAGKSVGLFPNRLEKSCI